MFIFCITDKIVTRRSSRQEVRLYLVVTKNSTGQLEVAFVETPPVGVELIEPPRLLSRGEWLRVQGIMRAGRLALFKKQVLAVIPAPIASGKLH